MREAFSGLIGALIGGLLTFLGSWYAIRKSSRLELSKLKLSYLMEKKVLIEMYLEKSNYDITGDMEQDECMIRDEFCSIGKFIRTKSHFFLDSNECQNCLYELVGIENEMLHNKDLSPLHFAYEMRELDNKFLRFIKSELESTIRKIHKIIGD